MKYKFIMKINIIKYNYIDNKKRIIMSFFK
jgi:hypothetical protein